MAMNDFINHADLATCDVIRDLIPLAVDGVASEDSVHLLERHFEHCDACKKIYGEMSDQKRLPQAVETDDKKIMAYIRKRYVLFVALMMMIGAVVGVLFIDTKFIFQNFLLMPLVGALSYVCFKEKGAIMAGVVVLLSLFRGAIFLLSTQPDMAAGSAEIGFIMALFVLMGFFATWLLAFAFRREKKTSTTNDIEGMVSK